MLKAAISRFWKNERYHCHLQHVKMITSNFIFNIHDLSLLFICTRQDGDAHVQLFKCCSSIKSMNKRYLSDNEAKEAVENDDHTLIVYYIDTTIVTAETDIKACLAVPACFHKDYQWNRVRRVKHGGHQFHHGIGLHAHVGVLQSPGQSLIFCAYRLIADREDTNVAEAKTFRPTKLLVHPGRSGCNTTGKRLSPDVQPTQPATFYLKLRATESKTNRCADREQAVNAPRWLMLTLVTTRWLV
ncbi:hypothetical protein T07_6309 [Trichinella nelsoni]|uniref:Uncharacterized protein n=1 Tax=Trichinella nelsoni TaxID=6336 RepID=A0A0V0RI51_9BILA|nr:hypothetical protein T07_6309 [Trichinella nelsoni]